MIKGAGALIPAAGILLSVPAYDHGIIRLAPTLGDTAPPPLFILTLLGTDVHFSNNPVFCFCGGQKWSLPRRLVRFSPTRRPCSNDCGRPLSLAVIRPRRRTSSLLGRERTFYSTTNNIRPHWDCPRFHTSSTM